MPLNHKKVSTIFSPVFFARVGEIVGSGEVIKKVAPIFEFFPLCCYIIDEPIKQ